jgi:protein O-mannosyl-transferase
MSRKRKQRRTSENRESEAQKPDLAENGGDRRGLAALAVCCLLVLAVIFVFSQTLGHGFVNYDDNEYIYQNPKVVNGFTPGWFTWAMTTHECNNWHPLTWFSHILDGQIFGQVAGGHHAIGFLLHAASAVILFLVLWRMTGDLWCGAFVAAVFAVHPLRVESVAWASERKDILSGLFFMLALGAYVRYARRPFSWMRYLAVVACFALGLCAKPMLVTLPFVLLLLDYWPLGRMSFGPADENAAVSVVPVWRLFVEKVPLFLMSAASCVVTVWAQGEAIQPLERMSVDVRIANAAVSCVAYLGKMFYPVDLAVIYPHRSVQGSDLLMVQFAGALIVLAAITVAVVVLRRKAPYLLVGWLWYLGMLLPVIGLVQVGAQAMADRYTYLPQIGIYVAVAWGIARITQAWPHRVLACGVAAALSLAVLSVVARQQTSYWRDGETLFRHAIDCTSNNVLAYSNLGVALCDRGDDNGAIEEYKKALAIAPKCAVVHNHLADAYRQLGYYDKAIEECWRALAIEPTLADAYYTLGESLRLSNRFDEAIDCFVQSLKLKPNRADAHSNLGAALGQQGKVDEAIKQFLEAIEIDPNCAQAHRNLGVALLDQKKFDQALMQFRVALALAEQQGDRQLAEVVKGKIDFIESHLPPQ